MQPRILCKRIGETLPQFLERLSPVKTTVDSCEWIGVDKGGEEWEAGEASKKVVEEFKKYCSPERMDEDDERTKKLITIEGLSHAVFEKHGAAEGKWFGFVDRDDMEAVWGALCTALYDDLLEDRIQATPADPATSQHAIAVLTTDYTDRPLQERIVKAIRQAGVTSSLHLKPLAATHLALYPNTYPWGNRATTLFFVSERQHHILGAAERSKRDSTRFVFRSLTDAL
eukprot:TRINITY_DN2707_c0_g3_i5.p1 TRINITY_DN2707_c0_g3~~TRINITY_DN2707_c0_g3_i5.p1  ORF type:complete len:249 (+),score=62.33 TRINITY_DN2707_c0_g3_i5:66-749(+)